MDVPFPQAPRITLVCDHLNPHKPGVLYERYEAATARHIARRLEWVHTPRHASWLHIAKDRDQYRDQCPQTPGIGPCASPTRRRCGLRSRPGGKQRNQLGVPVQWRFTTDDARKLQSLCPPV